MYLSKKKLNQNYYYHQLNPLQEAGKKTENKTN
jgi:hypothetical protein